ncbi:MAG TPA: FecR domain-containing protein [Niastella sp.]
MSSSNENELPYKQAVRIAGLIHKIREKQPLQAVEQQELEDWLNSSEGNKKLFEFLHDREQLTAELEALMQYDENNAVAAIFKALGERSPPAVRKVKTMIRRWSVAASLLLLIGVASWFFIRRGGLVQPNTPSTAGIQSGTNKAVLTLASGQQVMLDTLQTRSFGTQGAAHVEQQQGRLVYTAGGNGPVTYNTVTTPRGVQYRLALADGSEVWLNAASSITYPTSFTGKTREVVITGEAYFSVAKDRAKPFFVTAQTMKVEVVGTEFDVMAYNDEDAIRTTLVNGMVKASNTSRQGRAQELTLRAGEQAALVHRSGVLRMEKPNLDDVTAWRLGKFSFHETDMTAIMRQVARWYNVHVEYRGSIAGIGFSGHLSRKERIEELLNILSDTRNVHFEIKGDTTIVVIPGPK